MRLTQQGFNHSSARAGLPSTRSVPTVDHKPSSAFAPCSHSPPSAPAAESSRGLSSGKASKPSIHPSNSKTSGGVVTTLHSLSGARSPFPSLADLSYRGTRVQCLAAGSTAEEGCDGRRSLVSPSLVPSSPLVNVRIVRRARARSCVPALPRTCSKGFVGYLAARASCVHQRLPGTSKMFRRGGGGLARGEHAWRSATCLGNSL